MNKFLKILVFLVIINLIIFILLNFIYKEDIKEEDIQPESGAVLREEEINKAEKQHIYIENMVEISDNYEFTIPIAYISTRIEDIIQNLLNNVVEIDNKKLQEYFEQNREVLKNRLKVDNIDKLKNIKDKLEEKIVKAKIQKGSVTKQNNIIKAKIQVTLKNNKTKILDLEINEEYSEVYIY